MPLLETIALEAERRRHWRGLKWELVATSWCGTIGSLPRLGGSSGGRSWSATSMIVLATLSGNSDLQADKDHTGGSKHNTDVDFDVAAVLSAGTADLEAAEKDLLSSGVEQPCIAEPAWQSSPSKKGKKKKKNKKKKKKNKKKKNKKWEAELQVWIRRRHRRQISMQQWWVGWEQCRRVARTPSVVWRAASQARQRQRARAKQNHQVLRGRLPPAVLQNLKELLEPGSRESARLSGTSNPSTRWSWRSGSWSPTGHPEPEGGWILWCLIQMLASIVTSS